MIEVAGLTKRFGSATAVSDLSFHVQPGRVTGFLGPNGSGKSTTMRCILALDRPSGGVCRVNGKHMTDFTHPLREVGALLDASAIHPKRRAVDHLRVIAAANDLPAARIDAVIEMVGLGAVARQRAGGYSLGMKQRLGLAAALLGDPHTLMFDEPANGLDPEGITWMRNFIRYLAGQGRTVLVSSHLLAEMALTADDLVVIGKGQLIAAGPVNQFVEQNSRHWVRVRSPQLDVLESALRAQGAQVTRTAIDCADVFLAESSRVGEVAASLGVVLHELAPQRSSLEDAFLEVTKNQQEFHATVPLASGAAASPPVGASILPPPPPPAAAPSDSAVNLSQEGGL
jgi:ABC-2 type transport system ATP-binding protein